MELNYAQMIDKLSFEKDAKKYANKQRKIKKAKKILRKNFIPTANEIVKIVITAFDDYINGRKNPLKMKWHREISTPSVTITFPKNIRQKIKMILIGDADIKIIREIVYSEYSFVKKMSKITKEQFEIFGFQIVNANIVSEIIDEEIYFNILLCIKK